MTVKLLPRRINLQDEDFRRLARSIAKMRRKHKFAVTAWVFLPDHWHAIIYPSHPLSISVVLKAVKVSSMISINVARGTGGELWQGRFFDRALCTVKEYHETVEYIHLNPVRRGLVEEPRTGNGPASMSTPIGAQRSRSGDAGWPSTVSACQPTRARPYEKPQTLGSRSALLAYRRRVGRSECAVHRN